jgi:hypothetical protein
MNLLDVVALTAPAGKLPGWEREMLKAESG